MSLGSRSRRNTLIDWGVVMAGRGRPRLPRRVEREFWRKVVLGLSTEDAAAAVGVSLAVGIRWFRDGGGMATLELSEPSGRYLSMVEREEIAVLRGRVSGREIGRRLGRPASTVSRELRRNATGGQPARYRTTVAQAEADRRARRPKVSKLAACEPLREYVAGKLGGGERWSPEQIAHRIVADFPDDEGMRISHEAIYQALYVQGRGALRRELTVCLRTGRALGKPRRRVDQRRERIKDKVLIADRPAEVADRAVPGHWEGDHDAAAPARRSRRDRGPRRDHHVDRHPARAATPVIDLGPGQGDGGAREVHRRDGDTGLLL